MPHIHVQYMRRWKRALPHFDVRICPECAALVFKQEGQDKHRAEHDHMRAIIQTISKLTGIPTEAFEESWEWSAVVDSTASPLELEAGRDVLLQAWLQRVQQPGLPRRDRGRRARCRDPGQLPAWASDRPDAPQSRSSLDVPAGIQTDHGERDTACVRARVR